MLTSLNKLLLLRETVHAKLLTPVLRISNCTQQIITSMQCSFCWHHQSSIWNMWIALCKYADTYCERQALLNVSCCFLIAILIDLLERPFLKQRIPVFYTTTKPAKWDYTLRKLLKLLPRPAAAAVAAARVNRSKCDVVDKTETT